MGWITALAIFFVIWWTVLFAVLPFGMRSQEDDQDVVLGTARSAPSHFSFARKAFWTTVVSIVVFAVYYVVTQVYGVGPASFPNFFPTQR